MSQRPMNRMEAAINTEPMIIAYELFMRLSMTDLTRSYHQPENLRHSKEKSVMAMPRVTLRGMAKSFCVDHCAGVRGIVAE